MAQVLLVTGATSGIGRATACALAGPQSTVVLVGRDRTRGEDTAAIIRTRKPGANVEVLVADLSRLAEVRRLADECQQRFPHLDVLVNNAGIAFGGGRTLDGFDPVFATNHLAPFLLTNLLKPSLHEGSRVVTVASSVHKQVKSIPWDNLGQPGGPTNQYALSKLGNILFTRSLAQRWRGTGITANAADPGFVRTGLGRGATGLFRVFITASVPFQASPVKGARTPIFLASDPSVSTVSGGYFAACTRTEPSALARDDAAAQRLWDISSELCRL
jgi:NAD(P)-dependent dehydrogenase (short-subunit alcohol dehydrogenase family)